MCDHPLGKFHQKLMIHISIFGPCRVGTGYIHVDPKLTCRRILGRAPVDYVDANLTRELRAGVPTGCIHHGVDDSVLESAVQDFLSKDVQTREQGMVGLRFPELTSNLTRVQPLCVALEGSRVVFGEADGPLLPFLPLFAERSLEKRDSSEQAFVDVE